MSPEDMDARQAMKRLQALASEAHLRFSLTTDQWYVSAPIEISDGTILTGVCEHRDTPLDALLAFESKIKAEADGTKWLAVQQEGQRSNFVWNGAAFQQVHNLPPIYGYANRVK